MAFLDKVAASSKAGVSKPASNQRRRAGATLHNLASLSGVLDEVQKEVLTKAAAAQQQHRPAAKTKPMGQSVHSGRARAAIQATETARLQQVLQHPVFQSNPIAAITNHLKSTLPAPPAAPSAREAAVAAKGTKKAAVASRQERKKQARRRKQQQQGGGGPMGEDDLAAADADDDDAMH